MGLSIIIVSWNVRDKLRENLTAIFKSQVDFSFEVFVVDNNSRDGSADMVKEEFKNVKLITNQENLGFGKANNQAIKKANGKFILLLNPDMRVLRNTLDNMIKWMSENKQAAVAGGHLVDSKGETVPHVRRWPTIWDQLAIVLKLPHLFSGILNKYLRADFDYSRPAKVDSIRGGFFFINPDTIRKLETQKSSTIPLFDERYFLWFEEVDYCRQIEKAGGEVWYTPVAKCVDYVGQSFKQLPRGKTQDYARDSMLKYFKKWHPAWQYWLLRLAWPIGKFLAVFGEKIGITRKAKT